MLYGLERTFNVASTGIRYVGRCWRIVYDNLSILPLVDVIRHYLYGNEAKVGDETKKQAQAMNVDPINQIKHRWAFCTAAKRAGLYVDQQEFPGRDDLVLLRISPSGKKWSSEIKGTSANIFFLTCCNQQVASYNELKRLRYYSIRSLFRNNIYFSKVY